MVIKGNCSGGERGEHCKAQPFYDGNQRDNAANAVKLNWQEMQIVMANLKDMNFEKEMGS